MENIETTKSSETTDTEKTYSEFWATIHEGQIAVLGSGYPPQELVSCQIVLTKEEYNVLHALHGNLENVKKVIEAVQAKIKANGS